MSESDSYLDITPPKCSTCLPQLDTNVYTLAANRPKKRAGRRIFKETRHPVYKGVRQRNNKWVCELRQPNTKSRLWLGTYPTPEMAARAHDVAALALRGKNACLNFADSAWRLPVPDTPDSKGIAAAASKAAAMFDPQREVIMVSFDKKGSGEIEEDHGCVFDMEGFVANMAMEPLMSPVRYLEDCGFDWESVESELDMSLWSYSI